MSFEWTFVTFGHPECKLARSFMFIGGMKTSFVVLATFFDNPVPILAALSQKSHGYLSPRALNNFLMSRALNS
jgi:hypothetical protein